MLPRQFYSLRQKINERMPHGPVVSTVYMLHEVYADGEAPADAACAVSLSRFTAWLDRLPADRVGTPEQLNEQGAVLLTFDDMFASAYRYALPELRRRKLSYTVFIAPGLLGRKNYITEDELRTLAIPCAMRCCVFRKPLLSAVSCPAAKRIWRRRFPAKF